VEFAIRDYKGLEVWILRWRLGRNPLPSRVISKAIHPCIKEKQTFNVRPCISVSSFVEYEKFVKCWRRYSNISFHRLYKGHASNMYWGNNDCYSDHLHVLSS